jgi:hypothetical protein
MTLVWPAHEYLPSYIATLQRGWSPDNLRGPAAAREHLARIAEDPDAFLSSLVDRAGAGAPIILPDGTVAPRRPGFQPWMRRRGFATQALGEILLDAKAEGLRYVELTTRVENLPSRRVIEANGGVLKEQFVTSAALGGHVEVRYRVQIPQDA